ncbi:hypothetical protein [Devosia sp. LjRoot3]|uniref:hypothetical protein n=1 Tax=Devosia sp. LjRoot3 TaxID=3342319 RepID=UPI003ED079C4
MSLSIWRADAASAFAEIFHEYEPTERSVKRALFALDEFLTRPDRDFHNAYTMLQEASLQAQQDKWFQVLSAGAPSLRETLTEKDMVLVLAGVARALDSLLLEFAASLGPQALHDITSDDVDGYIIRRKRPRPATRLKPNQSYSKRGLIHHRVIPKIVGGLPVHVHFANTMAAQEGELPIIGVAAAFPGLALDTRTTSEREGGPSFRAFDAKLDDADAVLATHLQEALEPGVFTVVWPELTVPPARLKTIRRGLGKQRITKEQTDLQVVVAGSWHVERDGKWWNSAPILDAYGKVVATYEKISSFYSGAIGYEDIELGLSIPVVVTDDYIVAVAICKDFCDPSRLSELARLDVDIFLVPSMGGSKTLDGHKISAAYLAVERGTRAFVVQQPDDGTRDPVAWVMGMVENPQAAGAVTLQTESARSYTGNFAT